MAYHRPHNPTELAEQRIQLVEDQALWDRVLLLALAQPGYIDPSETRTSLREARLWWTGEDCCDLLAQAAPGMPPVTLDPDYVPDTHGLVYFERPIIGRDAVHPGVEIGIDALQWQPGYVQGIPGLAITTWGYSTDPQVPPIPLGRADWPFGFDTDHELPDTTPQAMVSIIEDRRLLAALWQLSSQTDLVATSEDRPNRPAARRIARKGYTPDPIRRIYLNPKTGRHRQAPSGTREYMHRWVVGPHWRQQPYGPGRTLRRARYIAAYLKGPEDKPLRVRDSVKVWTRRT